MERSKSLNIAIEAVNRFMFFSWNYSMKNHVYRDFFGNEHNLIVPRFLSDVKWNCTFDHILDKWREATESHNTDAYLPAFYARLGRTNRERLLEWALTHFDDEQELLDGDLLTEELSFTVSEQDAGSFIGKKLEFYDSWCGSSTTIMSIENVALRGGSVIITGNDPNHKERVVEIPVALLEGLVIDGSAEEHQEIDHCDVCRRYTIR